MGAEELADEQLEAEQVAASRAWLLSLTGGSKVAIGHNELRHLLIEPPIYSLPHAPRFCLSLVQWEDRLLPVHRLGEWLNRSYRLENEVAREGEDRIFAVLGFNLGEGRVDYGAIEITDPPDLIEVRDDALTDMDRRLERNKIVFKSTFKYEGKRIPIINIKYLYTGVFSQ